MSALHYRAAAIEAIVRKILMEYDAALFCGEPCAIPIETMIEKKFEMILEFQSLRKNGQVLGETIFDDGVAVIYDGNNKCYQAIAVKAGTVLIDESLLAPAKNGRLRFTCAHELSHWILHQKLYAGTGDVAAYNGKTSTDESDKHTEYQADTLATALLIPLPQIKKSFYRLRNTVKSNEKLLQEMAAIFEVSKQAMKIRLESHNLLN